MTDTISQDSINKALWAACDTFRGTISADTYKDFILTMLFLKYISDVWQDHYERYQVEYGDEPELISEMMKSERFVLPPIASFYALHERRHEPGNGERIDQALHAIEEANGTKLKDAGKSVFQDISFNTDRTSWVRKSRKTPSCAICWKISPSRNSTSNPAAWVRWM